jgi:DNA-binding MarR family transcriptional regulator/GNAT superfamily N-acetyltransferase
METPARTTDVVEEIRRFNRFYTRQLGLLDEGLLRSAFSLSEARVLYELAQCDTCTARALGHELRLDAGYLSRLLKKFEARGLLTRTASSSDGRELALSLTAAGRAAFAPLNEASRAQAGGLLAPLDDARRHSLLRAMQTITALLTHAVEPSVPYLLRPLQVGDAGWITHRQALFYAAELGFDERFEALVAEILAGFINNFDARRERAWIAERDGAVVGSIFLMRESDEQARLRLLYVEAEARGLGIGARLVDECVRFARAKNYRSLTLWTNAELLAARRLYEAAGFKLVGEERGEKFGTDFRGQTWTLAL